MRDTQGRHFSAPYFTELFIQVSNGDKSNYSKIITSFPLLQKRVTHSCCWGCLEHSSNCRNVVHTLIRSVNAAYIHTTRCTWSRLHQQSAAEQELCNSLLQFQCLVTHSVHDCSAPGHSEDCWKFGVEYVAMMQTHVSCIVVWNTKRKATQWHRGTEIRGTKVWELHTHWHWTTLASSLA